MKLFLNDFTQSLIKTIVLFTLAIFLAAQFVPTKTIVLTADNTINLNLPVMGISVDRVLTEYTRLRKLSKDRVLYLVIESPGGMITEGTRLINALKKDKNLHTITIFGASMASAIAQALPGKRYIIPNGAMMFHRASGAMDVSQVIQLELNNANRIGITLEDYRMNVLREWWIIGKDNLKLNTADEIVKLECDKSLDKASDTLEFVFMGETRIIITAKCPLVNQPLQ